MSWKHFRERQVNNIAEDKGQIKYRLVGGWKGGDMGVPGRKKEEVV